MRSTKIALLLTVVFAGFFASNVACAQRFEKGVPPHREQRGRPMHERPHPHPHPHPGFAEHPSEAAARSAVPPDLEQRRWDGHMTPEERHLLRQHIEDAVRELYNR